MADTIEVRVPNRYMLWFRKHRTFPAQITVTPMPVGIAVAFTNGPVYRVQGMPNGRWLVSRACSDSAHVKAGVFTMQGVVRAISDTVLRDLGVIRAYFCGTKGLAPIGYLLSDGQSVHIERCYRRFVSQPQKVVVVVKQSIFFRTATVTQCCICKRRI